MIGPAGPLKYLNQYLVTVPPILYGVFTMMVHIVSTSVHVCACACKHVCTHVVEKQLFLI